jgi:hypothetical protein
MEKLIVARDKYPIGSRNYNAIQRRIDNLAGQTSEEKLQEKKELEDYKREEFGEPIQKGNKWVQKNLKTGRFVEAYSDPEGWSDPYTSQLGNRVQKNLTTGEIRKVESPQKGIRIQTPDKTIIETGVTPGKGEKQMPAGEVSKIGEFDAYIKTMDEIQGMINKGELDKASEGIATIWTSKTGPMEPIRKALDNWGVLPDTKRIELRALVARLPGLMYAMRGKQLSDKELEVALNMMPQMNLADEAFVIQLRRFNDYMETILAGKEKAFKGGGYDTGAFEALKDIPDDELLNKLGK